MRRHLPLFPVFQSNSFVALIGVSLLALSAVQGYHGYVLFVWLYGVCLGGFLYSLKMFTMERVKSRYFTRAWGFVQGAEAIPVLVGVPITGSYLEPHLARHCKGDLSFCFLCSLLSKETLKIAEKITASS
jgi:hypothetical protein